MSNYTLLKIGKSEFKRIDYKNGYISLANFFYRNNNKILDINDIKDQWENEYIYINKNPKKLKQGISRIKSMCHNFGLGKLQKNNNDYKVISSEFSHALFSDEIREEYNNDKFFGLEFEDFWFLQLIIKMKSDKKSILSRLLKNMIADNNLSGSFDNSIFLSCEYVKFINDQIKNKEYKKLLELKSSNSEENRNEKKDKYVQLFIMKIIEYIEYRNNHLIEDISNLLYEMIVDDILPDGFYEMFFYDLSNKIINKREFKKNYKENKTLIFEYIKNGFNDLYSLFAKRIIYGSSNSYMHINKNTLNSLPIIFNVTNSKYEINKPFFNLIKSIINRCDELSLMIEEKFYTTSDMLKILNIENIELDLRDLENKIQIIYSTKNMISLLNDIKDTMNIHGKLNKKEICGVLKKYVHFPNIIDENYLSLYFEYIISLSFLSKYNSNFTISDVKRSLNTKLGSNIEPIWHAQGEKNNKSGADAIIVLKNQMILVEPTIQTENIFKMEYESSVRHLKSIVNEKDKRFNSIVQEIKKNKHWINSYIVSIVYEKRIDNYIKQFNVNSYELEGIEYKNTSIIYFDIIKMIEFLSSN